MTTKLGFQWTTSDNHYNSLTIFRKFTAFKPAKWLRYMILRTVTDLSCPLIWRLVVYLIVEIMPTKPEVILHSARGCWNGENCVTRIFPLTQKSIKNAQEGCSRSSCVGCLRWFKLTNASTSSAWAFYYDNHVALEERSWVCFQIQTTWYFGVLYATIMLTHYLPLGLP